MSREDVSGTPSTVGVEDHREKATDPDDDEEGTSGKAKASRKRYSKQMVNSLLDTIEEYLPYGNREWDMVVQKFNITFQESRDYASVRKKFLDMAVKGSLPTPTSAENMRADAINKKIILKQQAGAIPNSAVQEKGGSLSGPIVFRNISPPTNDEHRVTGHKRSSEPPEGLSAILRKILYDPPKSRNSTGGVGIAMTSSQSPSPPNGQTTASADHNPHPQSLPLGEINEVLTDILGSSERLQDLLYGCESQFSGVHEVQRAIQGLFLALRGFIDYNRPRPGPSSAKKQKTEDDSSREHGGQEGERLFFEPNPHNNSNNAQLQQQPITTNQNHFDEDDEEPDADDEGSGVMDVAETHNGNGHSSSNNGRNAFDDE